MEQKGMYVRSVANIAEQLGLPTAFVDIRHAGTHDYLPSLNVLRVQAKEVHD
jgi:ribosomal biogenesis protein LAS1